MCAAFLAAVAAEVEQVTGCCRPRWDGDGSTEECGMESYGEPSAELVYACPPLLISREAMQLVSDGTPDPPSMAIMFYDRCLCF